MKETVSFKSPLKPKHAISVEKAQIPHVEPPTLRNLAGKNPKSLAGFKPKVVTHTLVPLN